MERSRPVKCILALAPATRLLLHLRSIFRPVAVAGFVTSGLIVGCGWNPVPASKIAFYSDRTGMGEVWVMDFNGANQASVSNGEGGQHSWNPAGTRIAFISSRTGQPDVWLVNANGTGLTQLTNDSAIEAHPHWSPSGTKLIYSKGNDLVEYDLTTSTETTIVNTGVSGFPRYSPSGAEIVFLWIPAGSDTEIAKVPATGGPVTNLTNDPANHDMMPKWTPNGSQIAWIKSGDLWIMSANGTGQVALTSSGSVRSLDFAPNGVYLAYDDAGNIWRMTGPGPAWTSPVQLTTTGLDFTPSWASNSLQIAFMSLRTGNAEIWRMRFDGSLQVNLTNHPAVDEDPRSQP